MLLPPALGISEMGERLSVWFMECFPWKASGLFWLLFLFRERDVEMGCLLRGPFLFLSLAMDSFY